MADDASKSLQVPVASRESCNPRRLRLKHLQPSGTSPIPKPLHEKVGGPPAVIANNSNGKRQPSHWTLRLHLCAAPLLSALGIKRRLISASAAVACNKFQCMGRRTYEGKTNRFTSNKKSNPHEKTSDNDETQAARNTQTHHRWQAEKPQPKANNQ